MPRNTSPLQEELRSLLRDHFTDGASAHDLAFFMGKDVANVRAALKAMPDVYIDRWDKAESKFSPTPYVAVFCAAEIPADCPPPEVA